MGVEFSAHLLDLGVGLLPDLFQQAGLTSFEDDRIGQTLATDVGASRVIGVVDPEAGGLILAVQGDEFYSHDRAKMPFLAS